MLKKLGGVGFAPSHVISTKEFCVFDFAFNNGFWFVGM
jgi:hypothetical protein